MKISAVNNFPVFKGETNTYQEEIQKKSDNTVKLLIGTAFAAAGLLSVYYITKNPKIVTEQMKKGIPDTQHTNLDKPIVEKSEILKKNFKILKTKTTDGSKEIIEKTFLDKEGNVIKTQKSTLELEYNVGIPMGYKRTIITGDGSERVTELTLDQKPKRTYSNGNTIAYIYSKNKPENPVGYAYLQENKYLLKLNRNPAFSRIFDSLENIYNWSKTILRN